MPDYELFAPDDATMQDCLTQMNMKATNSGKIGNTVFATDYYGPKYLASGSTIIGLGGQVIPVMVAQPGVYCNIRWMGATALTLSQRLINAGCTLKIQTAPFYRVFAA